MADSEGFSSRLVPWLGSPRGITLLAMALAVCLRLPYLGDLAYPDEGGLLIVARHWHEDGPRLYGHLFVDRPPVLLLFWRLATLLGGLLAARLLALAGIAALVAAAGWAGHSLGGRRGTAWAAVITAALVANPALGAQEINAELLGAPLTMFSCAALLAVAVAADVRRRHDLLVLLAGAAGAGALLMKQNLADGLVFGTALAVAAGATRAWPWRRSGRVLGLGAVGALLPLAATAVWAHTEGPGLRVLWFTLYQFRVEATSVIVEQSGGPTQQRLLFLAALALVSGLAIVVPLGLWSLRTRLRSGDPVTLAIAAMVAFELVSAALGGGFWPHYLIGLVPGAALLMGAVAGSERVRVRAGAALLAFAVASTVAATAVDSSAYNPDPTVRRYPVADWLHQARHVGDSGTVIYGHADILANAGLRPVYPYLWGLPTRTLDPQLDRMVRQLRGRRAPDWVITWNPIGTYGLDTTGRGQAALDAHYRLAATVCDVPVYLHRGVHRILPPPPQDCPQD